MNIPRTFCITLPETPDRTEAGRRHFAAAGVNAEFFNGIHAEKFGLLTKFPYELDHPGSGFNMGAKPLGILASHFMLWTALTMQPESHFLILEIDAQFPTNWGERMSAALSDAPADFDLLYVGSCCCKDRPQGHIKGDVWEVRYPLCTHAYIVAKKALHTLIMTNRKWYAPVDIAISLHSAPLLKVVTVLPRIVAQFDTVIAP